MNLVGPNNSFKPSPCRGGGHVLTLRVKTGPFTQPEVFRNPNALDL